MSACRLTLQPDIRDLHWKTKSIRKVSFTLRDGSTKTFEAKGVRAGAMGIDEFEMVPRRIHDEMVDDTKKACGIYNKRIAKLNEKLKIATSLISHLSNLARHSLACKKSSETCNNCRAMPDSVGREWCAEELGSGPAKDEVANENIAAFVCRMNGAMNGEKQRKLKDFEEIEKRSIL